MKLQIIVASTRPNRVGPHVAAWFQPIAVAHGKFDVELVDLAEVALPMFDEPRHPSLGQYEHEHTKRWSASVASADAFVVVTPEYNFTPPPSLVNAFDFVYREWNKKPIAFVSYGGVAGGARSVQVARQQVIALAMVPIVETVTIPFVSKQVVDGKFDGTDQQAKAATKLLDELHRYAVALQPLRG
jgi:NAD(P)H-dependent FMN reductase